MGRQRICLMMRYNGTRFHGSQVQPECRTVAGTLTTELERIAGHSIKLDMASRTDSGVHANGNYCAFDYDGRVPPANLEAMLNKALPEDLRIAGCWETEDAFNPRFKAIERRYVYRLSGKPEASARVENWQFCYFYGKQLDESAIDAALAILKGEHLFSEFAAGTVDKDKSRCRLLGSLSNSEGQSVFTFVADRFLRGMVRNLTAALLAVSEDRIKLDQLKDAVDCRKPLQLKPVPAHGLVLEDIVFPSGVLKDV